MRIVRGLAFALVASAAWAQPEPGRNPDSAFVPELPRSSSSADSLPTYSLTAAPFMLLGPVLQVNAERRLTKHFSASLFGGFGGRPGDPRFVVSDAGASLRLYPYKSTFSRGLHVGALAAWAGAWVAGKDDLDGSRMSASGHVFCAGPLIGYKYTWSSGLTTELQLLIVYGRMRGEGDFLSEDERPRWRRAYLALPLWNVGWSF